MWPRSCPVLLLSLLWTVGRTGAGQQQLSAVTTTLDPQQTLRLIVQEVTAKVDSRISRLASSIGRLDSRLINFDSRLSGIEARLTVLDFKQNTFDASLDDYSSRIEVTEAKLESGLGQLSSLINSTMERLDSRFAEVNGLAAEQSDRLERVSSRLDDLASRTDALTLIHPRDCSVLPNGTQSGIYQLHPHPFQPPVSAYCDLETDGGGWTVIQRRKDIEPRQDFNRNWTDYRQGFGDLNEEFWWGLENMWKLTGAEERQYELRVDLADFEGGWRYATYSRFRVGSEAAGFPLTVSGYSGNAGDSLTPWHNGKKFSTKDRDQDDWSSDSCAQKYKGGWWFKSCYGSFLNGHYLYGKQDKSGGVHWQHWRGTKYSLRDAEMKIRPV